MGLCNSPMTFQKMANTVFAEMIRDKEMFIFLDDGVIFGATIEEHNRKLAKFLKKVREANLKIQPDNANFCKKKLNI